MVNVVSFLVAFFAGVTAVAGVIVLESFFRNKLKELFDNNIYLIFFFLVFGYTLYALGELSFYFAVEVLQYANFGGIQDVYWSLGGVFIFISFFALILVKAKQSQQLNKLFYALLFSAALLTISGFFVMQNETSFFGYFYPVISSLIVAFSFSAAWFFGNLLGGMVLPVRIFFFASLAILLGDLFFSQVMVGEVQIKFLSDIFYLIGYALSGAAFITFRFTLHRISNNISNNIK